ncbi:MAG: peptidylprolyl isomerase [Acidocella sp.]|nr:peptidylprolyl isomerase [Acidocella sp.]
MLVWVRKLLDNWLAKGFFILLALVFVFWGISNVVTLVGSNTAIAHVNGKAIDIAAVQAEYQAAFNQAAQSGQGTPNAASRAQLANRALATVLREQVLGDYERELGVVAPDEAIHEAIAAIPAFQTNGVFDKAKFAQVLAANDTNPAKFLHDVRQNIADRQILVSLIAGAAPPAALADQIFAYISEQLVAETVAIPFSAQPAPPPPDEAVLRRYWQNHPETFTAPEYRTVKLVVLSPALLAPQEAVSSADLAAAQARLAAAMPPAVAQRSVQVILAGNLAASSRLQAAWKRGADWTAMQALAKKFDANPFRFDNTPQSGIPAAGLAAAVFSAPQGQVVGPVAGPSGLFLFKVTGISSTGPDAATLMAQAKAQLQLQQAQADVATDVDKLQDALAGQTPLDQLPGNLGLIAVQGTLDAKGDTPDGTPAPLPGDAALKAAILKAAFAAQPKAAAQLNNGPDGSYFALDVDKVTPPALRPYDQVHAQVLAAWTADEISREAETKAADLLAAVNGGKTLDDAASAAGDGVSMTAPFTRTTPADGMTSQMVSVLFGLKTGRATMFQTANGFSVATIAKVIQPDAAQDPADYKRVQQAMVKSMQDDVGQSFLAGLQARDKVSVDQKMLAQIYQ